MYGSAHVEIHVGLASLFVLVELRYLRATELEMLGCTDGRGLEQKRERFAPPSTKPGGAGPNVSASSEPRASSLFQSHIFAILSSLLDRHLAASATVSSSDELGSNCANGRISYLIIPI